MKRATVAILVLLFVAGWVALCSEPETESVALILTLKIGGFAVVVLSAMGLNRLV